MESKARAFKLLGVGTFAAVGGLLLFASSAFACTNLATLNLSTAQGPAGTQVTVTGSAFADTSSNSAVAVHWNGDNGPVIATITPDAAGAITPQPITIPANAAPGAYVIVATQIENGTGRTPWGLPARASFVVTGQGTTASARPAPLPIGSTPSSGVSGALIALTIALGLGGLVLFGVGAGTFLQVQRRRAAPSRVRSN